MAQSEPLTIIQLQRRLKAEMERAFPDEFLLRGEIASISTNSRSGHTYMDLTESRDGEMAAKVSAIIWRTEAPAVLAKFRSGTGSDLAAGMEVVFKVKVYYSEKFGLSMNVVDVCPEFTIGAKEIQRKETIRKLESEGLLDRQKQFTLTPVPYRLAVVSSPTAAGWGDFHRHLLENPWGYKYDVRLFSADMQGEKAPSSIIAALRIIYTSPVPFDAVLLLRGGGSEVDLSCFDDYTLCRALALTKVPLITAIGHDRDNHVADMVANMHVKTPTALAGLILETTRRQDEIIDSYRNRLSVAVGTLLERSEKVLSSYEQVIRTRTFGRLDLEEAHLQTMSRMVLEKTRSRLDLQEAALTSKLERISLSSAARLGAGELNLSTLWDRIVKGTSAHLDRSTQRLSLVSSHLLSAARSTVNMRVQVVESRLQYIESRIKGSDPRNPLVRGNSVVTDGRGVRLSSVEGASSGDAIRVMLPDGNLDCLVQKVTKVRNVPLAHTGEGDGQEKFRESGPAAAG